MSDTHGGNGRTMDALKERLGIGRKKDGSPTDHAPEDGDVDDGMPTVDQILASMPAEVRAKAEKLSAATGLPLEEMIEKLAQATARNAGSGIPDVETATALLGTLGTAYANEIKPLVALAGQAAPGVAKETAAAIAILFDAIVDGAETLKPQRARNYADTAWSRKSKLDAYVAAGFSRDEAFALVLAEVKPPDYSGLQRASRGSGRNGKKDD